MLAFSLLNTTLIIFGPLQYHCCDCFFVVIIIVVFDMFPVWRLDMNIRHRVTEYNIQLLKLEKRLQLRLLMVALTAVEARPSTSQSTTNRCLSTSVK